MPFKHKLSRRLAMIRDTSLVGLLALVAGCMDGGPLGSDLDSPGTASRVVGILATSDNPTVAPDQPTPVRAVAVTADGDRLPVEADWVALDGGELRDTVVNSKHMTYFSAKEPGDYRLVSFDRGKKFRDTTRVTVPKANSVSIAKIYILPAVVSLTVGQGQQFFVYGRTSAGDSVPVVASLKAAGGTASGLYYVAGDTVGSYTVVASEHGGPLTDSATVRISAPSSAPVTSPTADPVASSDSAPTAPAPVDTAISVAPLSPVPSSGSVELPRVTVDTRYVPPTGNTIVVPAGGNLQAALNAAERGDIIQLAAGATFTGNFVLPAKPGSGWITITTATALPPAGTRVTPQSAGSFARLQSPNAMPTVKTASSGDASFYRLMGLEVASTADMTYSLVQLYNESAGAVSDIPQGIILDRVYVHGNSSQTLQRCVVLNSRNSAVVDSWLSDCHGKGMDTQAIITWASPGPLAIENNYLEGAGENIMFGGADPNVSGVVPSDITIRRNYVYKPLSWQGVWTVKNLFEIKNAQRLLVEANVFENNWADGQTGFAFVLKSANQGGHCDWCVAQDLTIRSNLIKNSPGGFNIMDRQTLNGGTAIPANDFLITQNVLENVAQTGQAGTRILFQLLGRVQNITIAHNTGFSDDKIVLFDGSPTSALVIRDNLFSRGTYGVFGSNKGEGTSALSYYAPDGIFRGNIVVAAPATKYPTSNYYPTSSLAVGMTDYASGSYTLTSSSPYYSGGTDGGAPGADVSALDAAINGVK
jgi:hypothetical protein